MKKCDSHCGVPNWKHARSLARLLLLVHLLCFLLPPEWQCDNSAVVSWLAPAACVRQRLPVSESSWDAFSASCNLSGWLLCLHLLPSCLDLEPELPCAHFWDELPQWALSCDDFLGRMGSPRQSEICLFICCPEVVTVLRHLPQVKFTW